MGRLNYFFIIIVFITPCFATFAEDTIASVCTSSGFEWINNSHYNATESFDYPNGTINPSGFMLWGNADPGYGYVVDEVDGHAKVYELWDNDADPDNEKFLSATVNFNQAKGNWSFWFRMADPGNAFGIAELLSNGAMGASPVLAFGTASLGAIVINSDIACAESAGAGMTLLGTVSANQWHYVNVEFDNTSSTFQVTFDDNSPVTCNLYGDWGTLGATNQLFGTGAIISSASPNHYLWIDAINMDWDAVSGNNTVPSCCGDDGAGDTFYNGTISSTKHFCNEGFFYNQELDTASGLCEYYGYDWFSTTEELLNGTNWIANDLLNVSIRDHFRIYPRLGSGYSSSYSWQVFDWGYGNPNGELYDETPENVLTGKNEYSAWMTYNVTDRNDAGYGGGTLKSRAYKLIIYQGLPYADVSIIDSTNPATNPQWYRRFTPNTYYVFNSTYAQDPNVTSSYFQIIKGDNNYTAFYEPGNTLLNMIVWPTKQDTAPVWHSGLGAKWRQVITATAAAKDYRLFTINDTTINNVDSARTTANLYSNPYAFCCGDDGINDNFYNGTISTTKNFCHQGNKVSQSLDYNKSLCEYYNYDWIDLSVIESFGAYSNDTQIRDLNGWNAWNIGTNSDFRALELQDGEVVGHLYDYDTASYVAPYYSFSQDQDFTSNSWIEFTISRLSGSDSRPAIAIRRIADTAVFIIYTYDNGIGVLNNSAAIYVATGLTQGSEWRVRVAWASDTTSIVTVWQNNTLVSNGTYTNANSNTWSGSLIRYISFHPGPSAGQVSDSYLHAISASWAQGGVGFTAGPESCCGDDGLGDNFHNSSILCLNGSLILCGAEDGVCPSDYGVSCEIPDTDCLSYPENTISLCVNASTTWTWIPNYRAGESPYCCGNNGTSDDWLGLSSCCYNGYAMQSGNRTNSLYCSGGYLFDCNDKVSDAGGIDTNVVTGNVKGAYYCLANNTWALSYYTPSEVSVELPPGFLVSGNTYSGAINFTINNPLDDFQTYTFGLGYDKGYAHFTVSGSDSLTVTVPPLSNFVTYIDVYPVMSGEISFTLTMTNVNNPEDYNVEQFSIVVVPTEEDAGGVYYFDEVSIFEILVNFINQIIVLIT